jgi:uncharacterized protein (DUF58 family)
MPAYADLDSLVALEFKARGFSFRPRQPVHSLLAGRRASRMRGRGLDFEELRNYVTGDDVRTIDWRVTARMQKPYVRVYSEERDRPGLLVIDQRMNMFFGSRVSMKSVIAAELAALGAWRIFQQGDRIGAVVFNDQAVDDMRPHRSRAAVLQILQSIVRRNRELRADSEAVLNPAQVNHVLENVWRVSRHDFLIVVVSDFDGADDATRNWLLRLSQHNDVVCVLTYDPLAVHLPPVGEMVVSDGELQVEIPIGKDVVRKSILEASSRRIHRILAWQHEIGIPVVPLSTAEDVPTQVLHLLGGVATRRSYR